jgi:ABC-type lipoprotein export system ATPase subunit
VKIDIKLETDISESARVKQLAAMFDVPLADRATTHLSGDMPIEDASWTIGLIAGPSGSGKSSILNRVFGGERKIEWAAKSVIDDFPKGRSIKDIAEICQAVGFNTIPAWMRPYAVLSNGEKFRVEMARRMIECEDMIVVDEFTSVVDRQVARIASHAVQKWVRRNERQMVAASCHYDIIEWLQPDWVFDTAKMELEVRAVTRRPFCNATSGESREVIGGCSLHFTI